MCSGIKGQQNQKLMIFLSSNSSAPFHWVDHLVSCVLLIDQPNESCKNSKKVETNALSVV